MSKKRFCISSSDILRAERAIPVISSLEKIGTIITYDTDLHIHFTNRSLLQMLHLPFDIGGRVYEGMMAGSIFKIYHNGQDILQQTGLRLYPPFGLTTINTHQPYDRRNQ